MVLFIAHPIWAQVEMEGLMLDNMPRGTITIEEIEMGMTRSLRKVVTDEDIRFGMAAGAIATTKPGAIAALPTGDEIANFIAAGAG